MRPRSRYLLPFALNLVLLADEPQGMRLDGSARPVRYAVEIALRPGTDTFQGAVEIEIATRAPLDAIWMHAASLELGEISIDGKPARATPGRHQTMGFSPASGSIGAGKHILRAKYSGQVSSKSSAGVFQLQEAGRWYLYSQFQPTDARRAFPCFDEPVFKTPWTVTLVAPKEMVALANSPEVSREDAGGGMQRIRFAATRPLPSYLVAFAVGPFDMVDAGKVGRTPLRIAVPKGRSAEAAFSAQAIPQLLRLLEGYFGRPYPFTKLDSVVMPSSSFAMENPGLITYGATDLRALPESDTIKRKRMIANIAAHEVAHQWFGNLVTAAWWDDIWLNEAFASWLAEKIVGQWQPAWQAEANTALSAQRAMQTDSLASARKIRQPIVTDGDIANAFDGITYDKGSALVRMFEQWLGEDAFRSGVRRYIAKHADSSATAKDFLAAVGEAAKQDVSRQFGGFLDQSGVPEIAVALDCTRDRPRLILSTQRYLPLGSAAPPESPWMTPFCVRYESGGREFRECSVVSDPRSEMPLAKAAACPAWVLPNTEAAGYYRVRYHPALLEKLLEKGVGKLSMAEQVSFLGDVNAMVRSGALPPGPALALAPRFSGARDEVVSQVLTITGHVTRRSVPRQLKPKAAKCKYS